MKDAFREFEYYTKKQIELLGIWGEVYARDYEIAARVMDEYIQELEQIKEQLEKDNASQI